jgi:hypothetical protein
LQQSKEIVRLVDIGVLEEEPAYSTEWASSSPSFAIPKKNGSQYNKSCHWFQETQSIVETNMSPSSYSKDWGYDPFNGRVSFASAFDLNMGYYHIKLDADSQKICTIVFPWGKYKYKRLPMGIKIAKILMFFKMSCLSLSKVWNTLRPILMIC